MLFSTTDFRYSKIRHNLSLLVGVMVLSSFSYEVKAEEVVAENVDHIEVLKSLITTDVVKGLQAYGEEDVFQIVLGVCNDKNKGVMDSDFATLDAQWKSELGQAEQPAIARALTNPLSLRATQMQAESDGLFLEIFVMDAKGLNCGQSAATSDYWQGDEAKWQKTYLVGAEAVFIDEPEISDKLGVWVSQVNLSIKDKKTGAALGAVTYEINLTELERRKKQGVELF